jgi:hypothetical protein
MEFPPITDILIFIAVLWPFINNIKWVLHIIMDNVQKCISRFTPPLFPLLLLLCTINFTVLAAVVEFPDKNLEAGIRKAINKPTGDILSTDLVGKNVITLNLNSKGISDLSGLEY